ncbi:thioredoxin [Cupriavidus necator]|uniref:thioredoxin n=1 Tax=Cupriavidus necator TaxID=106590 RepID=UPI00339D8D46
MTTLLDPWTHAREIAQRLRHQSARLIVVLGAESWCEKCRTFRPVFDASASNAGPHDVWLWLDMEDHAEFIGPFLPPGLPMLLAYEGNQLTRAQVLDHQGTALDGVLADGRAQAGLADPGILTRIVREDWAP